MTYRYIRCSLLIAAVLACLGGRLAAQAASAKSVPERLGYPATARLLIIHADDLGMNHSVNQATFEAWNQGWITSASVLVPCPWFPEVTRWAKLHPEADLGIHLALTSEWTDFRWGPVSGPSKVPSLIDEHGYLPLDTDVVAAKARVEEAAEELRAQLDRARSMGIPVTHLDMHMAMMVASPAIFGVYRRIRDEYKLPALLETRGTHGPPAGVPVSPDEITVTQVITMEPGVAANDWMDWYKKQLAALSPGVYQLTVHLAYDNEEMRGATWDHPDWGAAWRQRDLDLVKSEEFQRFLKDQGFVLISWKRLAEGLARENPVTVH